MKERHVVSFSQNERYHLRVCAGVSLAAMLVLAWFWLLGAFEVWWVFSPIFFFLVSIPIITWYERSRYERRYISTRRTLRPGEKEF